MNDWEALVLILVLTLVPISLFATFAFVRVFRPFTERIADLLKDYLDERSERREERAALEGVRRHLEGVDERLDLLEERVDFTESLASGTRVGDREGGDRGRIRPGSREAEQA